MKAHQAEFPVTVMCAVLGVSISGYYARKDRPPSRRKPTEEIRESHLWSRGTYGAPRVPADMGTCVPTASGFLYLSVVVDAWSRRVVGSSTASHLRTKLVLDALDMAVQKRRPDGVIHHSDTSLGRCTGS